MKLLPLVFDVILPNGHKPWIEPIDMGFYFVYVGIGLMLAIIVGCALRSKFPIRRIK